MEKRVSSKNYITILISLGFLVLLSLHLINVQIERELNEINTILINYVEECEKVEVDTIQKEILKGYKWEKVEY